MVAYKKLLFSSYYSLVSLFGTEQSYKFFVIGVTTHIFTSTSRLTYNCDPYRGIISCIFVALPNATQPTFPYGGFSFHSNFSMTSTSFLGVPTSYGDPLETSCFSSFPS